MGAAADTASRFSLGNSDEEDIFEDEDEISVSAPSGEDTPKAEPAPVNEEEPAEKEEAAAQDTVSVSIDTEAALSEDGEEVME